MMLWLPWCENVAKPSWMRRSEREAALKQQWRGQDRDKHRSFTSKLVVVNEKAGKEEKQDASQCRQSVSLSKIPQGRLLVKKVSSHLAVRNIGFAGDEVLKRAN